MNREFQSRNQNAALAHKPLHTARILQRKCECGGSGKFEEDCEDCKKKKLQRRATAPGATVAPPIVHDVLHSPGQPLDEHTRAFFEPRFGHDFSKVRIHTDSRAGESARAVQAQAYTVGNDLVFGAGRFAPDTTSGRQLLAHELTHVVQQSHVGTAAVQRKLEVGPASDSLEKEADRVADEITSDRSVTGGWPLPPPSNGVANRVQRATDDSVPDSRASNAGTVPPNTGLIVEDEATALGPGQMRKTEFLNGLHDSVCATADSELKSVGRTAEGCPLIERWIAKLRTHDSQYIERAIRKYAHRASAGTAREYFGAVGEQVRQGVRRWATTGDLSGVPPELMNEMGGGGILGAIGGAVSGVVGAIGSAVSGIGKLFTKPRAGGAREANPAAVQAQLGTGTTLDRRVRTRMESAFGHDFSNVRVHSDSRATGLAADLNARAFTIGNQVAFAAGEYKPGTLVGDALIAHELAHVVQQRGGAASVDAMSHGDAGYSSLEEDADISAVGAMVSLWTGTKAAVKNLGAAAGPRLRSGLRLQRCGGKGAEAPKSAGPCVSDQGDTVQKKALPAARTLVSTAQKMLGQAGSNQDVAKAVQDNFIGATPAQVNEISANFTKIAGALENRIYYCIPPLGEVTVRGTDGVKQKVECITEDAQGFGTLPELFLCSEFFNYKTPKQGAILVHEAVHRGLGAKDIKYQPSGGMAVKDALQNPDSYVYLATDLQAIDARAKSSQGAVQRKASDGDSSEPLEQQADRIAQEIGHSAASPTAPSVPLSRAGLLVQRSPQTGSGTEPAAPGGLSRGTQSSSLIIEDSAPEAAPGQMRKSEFLEQLRAAVCAAADAELAAAKRNTQGCPYIEKWIGYYRGRSADQTARALQRYAPEAAGALQARDYIPAVTARVRRSVATWVATGKIQGVPEELASQLPGAGLLGAIGSVFAGVASAVSGLFGGMGHALGSVFAKSRDGRGPAKSPQTVLKQLGSGQPLEPEAKFRMEHALGYSFSHVRVHTDARAVSLSREMNARAFAVGNNIAFDTGQYQPGTIAGDILLAHELAHVVQQRAGGSVGDGRYNALEQDADSAAASAATFLWSPSEKGGARKAPALKSGLRLSRCGGEKGPGISYSSSCSDDSKKKISTASDQAKKWVNSAVVKLDGAIKKPGQVDHKTAYQLSRHFHIDPDLTKSPKVLGQIREGLATIQSGFGGMLPFQCEEKCPEGEVASTPVTPFGLFRITGDIHVCPMFFDDSEVDADERSAAVIHEMAHKYAGKGEAAYLKKDMEIYLHHLTTDDALDNADSFAQFARYVQD